MNNDTVYTTYCTSPLGTLEISGTTQGVQRVDFVEVEPNPKDLDFLPAPLAECASQLAEYFKGTRQTFSVKLDLRGTPFQQKVWQQLGQIPYGKTVTYLEVARLIGNEKAMRAVGQANGRNPVAIIVPCHRVIGQRGKLVGYGGGMWRKAWLLQHEQKYKNL